MHRNSQKRIYGEYVYSITCNVEGKNEFFRNEILCNLWIKELSFAKDLYRFLLFAFCLNYDHFHMLIMSKNEIANYSKVIHFLKRHFTRNANIILGHNIYDLKNLGNTMVEYGVGTSEGDIGQSRLRSGKHKPWQNEMDKFVWQMRKKIVETFDSNHKFPKFKWQKSFHDHIIRNQYDFVNHWNYTMYNFKKHRLPNNWQYTGLHYPELIDEIEKKNDSRRKQCNKAFKTDNEK